MPKWTIGYTLNNDDSVCSAINKIDNEIKQIYRHLDACITLQAQATQPTGVIANELWLNTDNNKLYRFNGSTWEKLPLDKVEYRETPPADAEEGDIYLNSNNKKFYVKVGNNWIELEKAVKLDNGSRTIIEDSYTWDAEQREHHIQADISFKVNTAKDMTGPTVTIEDLEDGGVPIYNSALQYPLWVFHNGLYRDKGIALRSLSSNVFIIGDKATQRLAHKDPETGEVRLYGLANDNYRHKYNGIPYIIKTEINSYSKWLGDNNIIKVAKSEFTPGKQIKVEGSLYDFYIKHGTAGKIRYRYTSKIPGILRGGLKEHFTGLVYEDTDYYYIYIPFTFDEYKTDLPLEGLYIHSDINYQKDRGAIVYHDTPITLTNTNIIDLSTLNKVGNIAPEYASCKLTVFERPYAQGSKNYWGYFPVKVGANRLSHFGSRGSFPDTFEVVLYKFIPLGSVEMGVYNPTTTAWERHDLSDPNIVRQILTDAQYYNSEGVITFFASRDSDYYLRVNAILMG
jgi:hypothetical protein